MLEKFTVTVDTNWGLNKIQFQYIVTVYIHLGIAATYCK